MESMDKYFAHCGIQKNHNVKQNSRQISQFITRCRRDNNLSAKQQFISWFNLVSSSLADDVVLKYFQTDRHLRLYLDKSNALSCQTIFIWYLNQNIYQQYFKNIKANKSQYLKHYVIYKYHVIVLFINCIRSRYLPAPFIYLFTIFFQTRLISNIDFVLTF